MIQTRQVSTQPEKVQAFFTALTRDESFIAVVEVCGFNDWLLKMLQDYRCHRAILIQPEERKKQKTDRRDASSLSELLWVNRARFLAGKPVRALRQVEIGSTSHQEDRRLTTLRQEASQAQTQIVNKITHLLRRHNLQWSLPTKTFPTREVLASLTQLVLPTIGWRWIISSWIWSNRNRGSWTWNS